MTKLKLIHIGLGAWGGNWAAHVLPHHPEVETVAFVDMVPEKRAAMQQRLGAPPEKFFASLDEAVAKTDGEAVSIAVPIALHEPLARQALEAGKHVVLEKPFAATMAEARGLVALAADKNRILAISQNYRFYPAARLVAELVHSGYFGRIVGAKIDFRRNAFAERSGNINVPNPILADMAVHHYDLMRMLIGADPVEVNARAWNPKGSPYRDPPSAAMVLTFPDNVTVSYRGSWIDSGPQTPWAGEWELECERATILWTGRGDQPWQTRRDRVQIRRPNSGPEEVALPEMALHDRAGVLGGLAEMVQTGATPRFFPLASDNLGTLATIQAALQSAAAGGAAVRVAEVG